MYVFSLQSFARWLIHGDQSSSAISCIDSYNLSESDTKNLIVGRQDGTIEVYLINIEDKADFPKLIYLYVIMKILISKCASP